MEENILYKKCTRCKEVKQLSEFNKCEKSKDKLSFGCRDCEKQRVKLWLEKNRSIDKKSGNK
jgi:hypothetical protein